MPMHVLPSMLQRTPAEAAKHSAATDADWPAPPRRQQSFHEASKALDLDCSTYSTRSWQSAKSEHDLAALCADFADADVDSSLEAAALEAARRRIRARYEGKFGGATPVDVGVVRPHGPSPPPPRDHVAEAQTRLATRFHNKYDSHVSLTAAPRRPSARGDQPVDVDLLQAARLRIRARFQRTWPNANAC
ncbi:hypothetical protein M885DRAFT_506450 [Pelagophyceae sp. CCMP2097]|nr:hypothetical protein M885DRAFT_506450 [Pelagophyceae sp. CCMP2097]